MRDKYLRIMREAELGPYHRVDFMIRQGREVARRYSLVILIVVLTLLGFARLDEAVADSSVTVFAAQAPLGSYVISCLMDLISGIQPCGTGNQIPVGNELILKAHVEDSSGQPARQGSVIFQDCLVRGEPAPSTACVSGPGTWSHIITIPIDMNGNAEVDFGFVAHPRTIGFRFRYIGQRSGIANGESTPMDVTWVQ